MSVPAFLHDWIMVSSPARRFEAKEQWHWRARRRLQKDFRGRVPEEYLQEVMPTWRAESSRKELEEALQKAGDRDAVRMSVNPTEAQRAGILLHESTKALTTSFRELAFCLVNVAAEQTYAVLMNGLNRAVNAIAGLDLVAVPHLQIHGDQHKGLEAARCQVYPRSTRCLDFSHLAGCNRARNKIATELAEEQVRAYRKGIFSCLSDLLIDKKHLPLLEFAVFATRTMPQGIFSSIWQALLRRLMLLQPPEKAARDALLRYWLDRLPDDREELMLLGRTTVALYESHPTSVHEIDVEGTRYFVMRRTLYQLR
ncbi:unnamed protein product, partial [Effrenium voratum]